MFLNIQIIMLKRLFIGVFIEDRFFTESFQKIKSDFKNVSFGKWVELNNLHFTIKFLGDVDSSQIPEIKNLLKENLIAHECNYSISGLSVLPARGIPRVLYAGIEAEGNTMLEQAVLIDSALEELGFDKEERDFFPHISLLRMKSVSNDFRSVLKQYSRFYFGKGTNFKIDLIESKLTPNGPIYKIL